MDERNAELKRLERELLADEAETMDLTDILAGEILGDEVLPDEDVILDDALSVDDILADEELNALLGQETEPAFEDPDQTRVPDGDVVYNNFANDYGKEEQDEEARIRAKNDKIAIGLMLSACVLCLGIIGILIYWICVLP